MIQSQKNPLNLVWLDMEMSGLDVNTNVILEIAMVITDANLNILAQSESYVVKQPQIYIDNMDKWNTGTHTRSGLIQKVLNSTLDLSSIESQLIAIVKQYVGKSQSPLCGNTIHQDRKFLAKYMPELDSYLHYRNIDVSSIKELAKRWYPDIYNKFKKHNKHQALADVLESIEELKYYREQIMLSIK